MQQNKKTKHHIRYFRVGCALVTLGLLIGGAVFLMNRNSEKTAKSDDSSSADSQVNTSDVSVIYDSEPDEIGISAVRMGNIVGTHEVMFGTNTQTITVTHQAHDRALFADGAVAAARFLAGKPAGLYNMDDLLAD